MKPRVCIKCGKTATNYVVADSNGRGKKIICDACSGVIRDESNSAWFPGQTEMDMLDLTTGKIVIVQRPK